MIQSKVTKALYKNVYFIFFYEGKIHVLTAFHFWVDQKMK